MTAKVTYSRNVDPLSVRERSERMALVRSHSNKSTELKFIQLLRQAKITGWRRSYGNVLGKPDFYFSKERIAVFIDGCFWHGCPRCYRRPTASQQYWDAKVKGNIDRDIRVNARLRRSG